jgi:hypothetical protein
MNFRVKKTKKTSMQLKNSGNLFRELILGINSMSMKEFPGKKFQE